MRRNCHLALSLPAGANKYGTLRWGNWGIVEGNGPTNVQRDKFVV